MSDDTRDPALGALLRGAYGDPPVEAVDFAGLQARIRAQAELPLARARKQAAPSRFRLRALVPMAAAASVAVGLFAAGQLRAPAATPLSAEERAALEQIDASFSSHVEPYVTGAADSEALFAAAIGS